MHDVPAAPQALDESEVHVVPEQHPPGQEVESQTQLPW
jgi:hypothetical protein